MLLVKFPLLVAFPLFAGYYWVLSYCWLHTSPFFVHFPTGTEKIPCVGEILEKDSHCLVSIRINGTVKNTPIRGPMGPYGAGSGALSHDAMMLFNLLDLPLNWMMIMNHHLVGGFILKNIWVRQWVSDDIPYMTWKIKSSHVPVTTNTSHPVALIIKRGFSHGSDPPWLSGKGWRAGDPPPQSPESRPALPKFTHRFMGYT